MTTQITVANDALVAPFEAIDNAFSAQVAETAAAETQVTQLQAALQGDAATLLAQENQIGQLQAQLAALQSKVNVPAIGLACGTTQAAWDAAPSTNATFLRAYGPKPTEPAAGVPALWPKMAASQVTGPSKYVVSFNPDTDGSDVAKTAPWAASLPSDVYLAMFHEPEQKAKAISPALFRTIYNTYLPTIRSANPTAKVGAIFQCWVDDVSTPGANAWLTALAGLKLDFIGWDLYQKASAGYPSAESLLGNCLDLADQTFPGIEQLITEWGVSGTGTARAACITSSYQYFASRGVTTVIYFDENVSGQEAWLLNGDAPAVAAFEALGVAA